MEGNRKRSRRTRSASPSNSRGSRSASPSNSRRTRSESPKMSRRTRKRRSQDVQIYQEHIQTPAMFLISDIFFSLNEIIKNVYDRIYEDIEDLKDDLFQESEITETETGVYSDLSVLRDKNIGSALKIIEVLITYNHGYELQFRTPHMLIGEYTNLPRVIDESYFLENPVFLQSIKRYIYNLIYKGNLHHFLQTNGQTILTFDYYKNRRVGPLGFHQDNNGNSQYLTLSYISPTIGPEIISSTNENNTVPHNLRLKVTETIGLQNNLFNHSTPITNSIVPTDVPEHIRPAGGYSCDMFNCSVLRVSSKRARTLLSGSRNYLRGCWEKYILEKHHPFVSEVVTIPIELYECKKYTFNCVCTNELLGELIRDPSFTLHIGGQIPNKS